MKLGKPLHILLAFLGDRALSQYSNFSGKMVFRRPCFSDPGEALALHVHWSGIPGESFELIL